jgi:hypothetical protein
MPKSFKIFYWILVGYSLANFKRISLALTSRLLRCEITVVTNIVEVLGAVKKTRGKS